MTTPLPFQITIARQPGSGGAELGRRIACRMGLGYLDRQILQHAAEELKMTEADLAHREERIKSFWIRLIETFSTTCPEYIISTTPPPPIISDDKLIEAEKRVLLQLAAQGSCVIVGRCGFHVLGGQARLLNIFIHAPRRFRIERLIKFYGADSETIASQLIDSMDLDRKRYVERLTKKSWYDARNYHLSIDMSQMGFDAAEETIVSLANRIGGQKLAP
ncbi:MAG: cytidylate kinase-like family protein [Proteobacteria bacterium]|nr:cytidylate kinase-like family protein [Pseudomonadota bacterium]